MKKTTQKLLPYIIVCLTIIIVLLAIYKDVDLKYPLTFTGGDDNGVFYVVKTIRDYGITLENPDVGGFSGGNMYDYFECANISFVLVKLISLFVKDIYIITNIFYFTCYVLSGVTAYYAASKLLKYKITAGLVSVLFTFSYFIQVRYGHMWLCPIFILPLVCLVAIYIARGEIFSCGVKPFNPRKYWQGIVISLMASGTGLYYAYFTCAIYAIAIVMFFLNSEHKTIKTIALPIIFIFSTIMGVIISVLPNLLYIARNGINTNSQALLRGIGDCEIYGLKIIQLILPRGNHRIGLLSDVVNKYAWNFPDFNENMTSSLGLIGAIGLVISLIIIFYNKQIDKTLPYFILGQILIGTIGGLSSVIALLVYTPMRCYNRMSVIILFFSLLVVANIIEKVAAKIRKRAFNIIVITIVIIGLFDQTNTYTGQADIVKAIENNKIFITEIENCLEEKDYVFVLPVLNWPTEGQYSLFNGYLASDKLRWSYGAAEGREEAVWQKNIGKCSTAYMVNQVIAAGYSGIYLDKSPYTVFYGEDAATVKANEITALMGDPNVIDIDAQRLFWKIK